MNTQERIEKMLKKADKILQAGKSKNQQLRACPYCGYFKILEEAVEAWNRRINNV